MKKTLTVISVLIIILSAAVCIAAIVPGDGKQYETVSLHGEKVTIHGRGLYAFDSESYAVQAKAQDWVTLVIGIPLLAASMIIMLRGSFRGRLLQTGMIGYFLYTYASYSFLMSYNVLFLVYVAIFSLSLYGFIISFRHLEPEKIKSRVKDGFPRIPVSVFMLLIAFILTVMWLGRIVPSIVTGGVPEGLETYTTLVIQALDLGVIVPLAVITALMLLKKRPLGYALSAVVVLKGAALFSAVSAMGVMMKLSGVAINNAELVIFPSATAVNFVFCFLIIRKISS